VEKRKVSSDIEGDSKKIMSEECGRNLSGLGWTLAMDPSGHDNVLTKGFRSFSQSL
jgi:hypothetical protein